MKAIISDIHANWEALQAVLQDAARNGAREIYCLGDLVGYGPNPREVVDLLAYLQLPVVLMGNHDRAALGQPHGFNTWAAGSLRWTKKELADAQPAGSAPEHRRRFLTQLSSTHREDGFLFVHGSPRDPVDEYVFPEDICNARKMGEIFTLVERCCFMGHTHVPGIFTPDLCFASPVDLNETYRINGSKVLCNVGSVGQSRDDDKRACYVLLDGDLIRFRRVDYDIDATLKKIKAIPELDPGPWLDAAKGKKSWLSKAKKRSGLTARVFGAWR